MMKKSSDTLQYRIDANDDALRNPENTFIFIHGFPDSPAVWEEAAQHYIAIRAFVVRVCLPGHSELHSAKRE